jgi:hypothetical protein
MAIGIMDYQVATVIMGGFMSLFLYVFNKAAILLTREKISDPVIISENKEADEIGEVNEIGEVEIEEENEIQILENLLMELEKYINTNVQKTQEEMNNFKITLKKYADNSITMHSELSELHRNCDFLGGKVELLEKRLDVHDENSKIQSELFNWQLIYLTEKLRQVELNCSEKMETSMLELKEPLSVVQEEPMPPPPMLQG